MSCCCSCVSKAPAEAPASPETTAAVESKPAEIISPRTVCVVKATEGNVKAVDELKESEEALTESSKAPTPEPGTSEKPGQEDHHAHDYVHDHHHHDHAHDHHHHDHAHDHHHDHAHNHNHDHEHKHAHEHNHEHAEGKA